MGDFVGLGAPINGRCLLLFGLAAAIWSGSRICILRTSISIHTKARRFWKSRAYPYMVLTWKPVFFCFFRSEGKVWLIWVPIVIHKSLGCISRHQFASTYISVNRRSAPSISHLCIRIDVHMYHPPLFTQKTIIFRLHSFLFYFTQPYDIIKTLNIQLWSLLPLLIHM